MQFPRRRSNVFYIYRMTFRNQEIVDCYPFHLNSTNVCKQELNPICEMTALRRPLKCVIKFSRRYSIFLPSTTTINEFDNKHDVHGVSFLSRLKWKPV